MFDGKVNLAGVSGSSKFKIPYSFQKHYWEKQKKVKDKREFQCKIDFGQNIWILVLV